MEVLDSGIAGYQVDRAARNRPVHLPEPVREALHRFREAVQMYIKGGSVTRAEWPSQCENELRKRRPLT